MWRKSSTKLESALHMQGFAVVRLHRTRARILINQCIYSMARWHRSAFSLTCIHARRMDFAVRAMSECAHARTEPLTCSAACDPAPRETTRRTRRAAPWRPPKAPNAWRGPGPCARREMADSRAYSPMLIFRMGMQWNCLLRVVALVRGWFCFASAPMLEIAGWSIDLFL